MCCFPRNVRVSFRARLRASKKPNAKDSRRSPAGRRLASNTTQDHLVPGALPSESRDSISVGEKCHTGREAVGVAQSPPNPRPVPFDRAPDDPSLTTRKLTPCQFASSLLYTVSHHQALLAPSDLTAKVYDKITLPGMTWAVGRWFASAGIP